MTGNKTLWLGISVPDDPKIGVGEYTYGDAEKGIAAGIEVVTGYEDENKQYGDSHSICDGNGCYTAYSGGSVKITRWGTVANYVEGEF